MGLFAEAVEGQDEAYEWGPKGLKPFDLPAPTAGGDVAAVKAGHVSISALNTGFIQPKLGMLTATTACARQAWLLCVPFLRDSKYSCCASGVIGTAEVATGSVTLTKLDPAGYA